MSDNSPIHVLLFSKTSGYRHDCIPTAVAAIEQRGQQTGLFTTYASDDAEEVMTPSSLEKYSVVVLVHCSGNFLSPPQLHTLQGFLQCGGGVVAIHGAAAGMPQNNWYGKLIGAHFDMHPDPQEGTVVVEERNADHEILRGCGGRTGWTDEWYNFTSHPRENERLQILLKGDTTSFRGGRMGLDHPLSWCQELEGGRVYYTALGHFEEAYKDDWFVDQIQRGIMWAAGGTI